MTANLWKIVQDYEIQIQKLIESNINIYSYFTTVSTQICSQSQAIKDSQLTAQQEIERLVKFAHLITADQKFYTMTLIIYKNKLKIYNTQWHKIQQLIEYIWKTVSSIYHKICCNSDLFIND